ncbi:MAG: cupin domain-containing protein [Candidatus Caldarchaeum sp.]|nr:cupin domain-containing protein [Candidatus Caldarchaeum sp.]MDW8358995.1 cupin domain-containing protein [Candidatus Caldarchaeum sp.]
MAVVKHSNETQAQSVERASRTFIQWLVDSRDGSENIYLRKFTIKPGGWIPSHSHPEIEHVQYVLRGEYEVVLDGETRKVKAGDVVFIPSKTVHSYRNTGSEDAEFLCIITSKPYTTKWENEFKPTC